MTLTGNKGEWSEIYAFFKLLADGKVYNADGQLNRIKDLYLLIKEIIRSDKKNEGEYKYKIRPNKIAIIGNSVEKEVSREEFAKSAALLYNYIVKSNPSKSKALSFPEIETFMESVKCFALKAKSVDKADIRMIVHDMRTSMEHKLGFSIKSKLGGKSTLFNSNKDTTNFLYEVTGIDDNAVDAFNKEKLFSEKFKLLESCGGEIKYHSVVNKVFRDNLIYIDSDMEKIIALSMLQYYRHSGRSIADIIEIIQEKDPCGYNTSMDIYSHKIKQALVVFALGMTSATPWNGRWDASGGYLVIKEDGDVVCYHFYDRNDLEDYLYYNTGFETPSTTRHNFGNIYKEGGKYWLKLNLQIRFLH